MCTSLQLSISFLNDPERCTNNPLLEVLKHHGHHVPERRILCHYLTRLGKWRSCILSPSSLLIRRRVGDTVLSYPASLGEVSTEVMPPKNRILYSGHRLIGLIWSPNSTRTVRFRTSRLTTVVWDSLSLSMWWSGSVNIKRKSSMVSWRTRRPCLLSLLWEPIESINWTTKSQKEKFAQRDKIPKKGADNGDSAGRCQLSGRHSSRTRRKGS